LRACSIRLSVLEECGGRLQPPPQLRRPQWGHFMRGAASYHPGEWLWRPRSGPLRLCHTRVWERRCKIVPTLREFSEIGVACRLLFGDAGRFMKLPALLTAFSMLLALWLTPRS